MRSTTSICTTSPRCTHGASWSSVCSWRAARRPCCWRPVRSSCPGFSSAAGSWSSSLLFIPIAMVAWRLFFVRLARSAAAAGTPAHRGDRPGRAARRPPHARPARLRLRHRRVHRRRPRDGGSERGESAGARHAGRHRAHRPRAPRGPDRRGAGGSPRPAADRRAARGEAAGRARRGPGDGVTSGSPARSCSTT